MNRGYFSSDFFTADPGDIYQAKLGHWFKLTDIIKASTSDIDYLYPGMAPDAIAKKWLSLGSHLVVITDGQHGATGYSLSTTAAVPGIEIDLVDSVGAGDAFTAGFLAWLSKHEYLNCKRIAALPQAELAAALTYATRVAAITCSRLGANPPWESELLLP